MSISQTEDQRDLIRRSLFRTIARSLIRQLCKNGYRGAELVAFANETLGAIADLGWDHQSPAGRDTVPGPASRRTIKPRGSAVQTLSSPRDRASIDSRLCLRRLRSEDLPTLREWLGDEAISASLASFTLRRILAMMAGALEAGEREHLFVLSRADEDKAVGLVGLTRIDRETAQAELVKMIGDPTERGKGYAKKATRVVLEYAFDVLSLNRVSLRTLDGNMKNICLNQDLGFGFEGLLRQAVRVDGKLMDVVLMACLRSEWQPGRPSAEES